MNYSFLTLKERDVETGLDYFLARYYSATQGRFTSVDPVNITDARLVDPQQLNLFVYARNNPLIYTDPDGKDIWAYLGNEAVGTTNIRLIGSENVEGAPQTVEVPVYNLYVRDSVNPDNVTIYQVTRDGPVLDQANPRNADGTYNILNTTFEPSENKDPRGWTNYTVVPLQYPAGTNLEAFALRETNGSSTLDAAPNPNADRRQPDKATEIMLHVGGRYTRTDGDSRITGSLGCFTLAGTNQGNAGMSGFVRDVQGRQATNRQRGAGTTIYFQIAKRSDVALTWKVNSSGRR